MERVIAQLQQENERLTQLAQQDWLTHLYNRMATQEKVNEAIAQRQTGLLLVIDVDQFKQINDRFGHIAGDQVLQQVAQVLRYLAFKSDVVGRVGGDEFVVYMPLEQDERSIKERARQINAHLREIPIGGASFPLTASVGGSLYQPGDDYQSLFDRADQHLLEEKRRRKGRAATPAQGGRGGVDIDMRLIREELTEQQLAPGAYCQDYKTFQRIYRFVERRLQRVEGSAYAVLITLTDGRGDYPALADRRAQMETLKEVILRSLRMGDVFTQYSSCQFLLMVSDLAEQDVEGIASRICDRFYRAIGSEGLLLHHCYPLQPAPNQAREG
ncbi:GGDEF domain-containing protein [Bittarella massiliensis (ex Durand et al. 2017)]|uniref:GGDEF domain-containing protein n=1 Tax=Bittarella massiliensis (ex Durand et al. 2017) TaxID=1720313 RepID=UPI001AA1A8B4|nr:GGDEF domain-containing protein [Bittarella massiliensis (ex Durand et al. 2017)]MBO1680326.1 GGDEF domain-containing protein [Bittarella massiliensis (ex Durand et al. 2017)]